MRKSFLQVIQADTTFDTFSGHGVLCDHTGFGHIATDKMCRVERHAKCLYFMTH